MKKQVACRDCGGRGFITLAAKHDDICGIGSEMCKSCDGTGLQEADMTRADRFRSLDDEALAQELYFLGNDPYCQNLEECGQLLDQDKEIPESKCVGCLLKYLQEVVS